MRELTAAEATEVTGGILTSHGSFDYILTGAAIGWYLSGPTGALIGGFAGAGLYYAEHELELFHLF